MNAKLGHVQESVLRGMRERGGFWFPGCGWIYDTFSVQIRTLKSLEAKGLVTRQGDEDRTARWDVAK